MVLASVIVFVAKRPVERIGARAFSEPLKAGLVGLLLELLFVPTVIVTIVLLLVTIIGIPLLALVPVVLLVAVAVLLLGFTSVAHEAGQWIARRRGVDAGSSYRSTLVGMVVLVAPLLIARMLGVLGGGVAVVTIPLAVIGFAVEYAAWTVGLGAAALVRFRPIAAGSVAPLGEPTA